MDRSETSKGRAAERKPAATPFDVYQAVTNRILEMLDRGVAPWRNPIRAGRGDGRPRNLESGRLYRGVNVFLLAVSSWLKGYGSAYWLTFRQAQARGGHVRAGEKANLVVFWKPYERKNAETGLVQTVPVLRYYNVFNVQQCEGLTLPDASEPGGLFEPLGEAERIIAGYPDPPRIQHAGAQACYFPAQDLVRLPEPRRFLQREFFYATAFHELIHSTGHKRRLDRGLDRELAPFGSPDYSREELIAELGAAFLCAAAGISPPTIESSASYIDGWRLRLRGDKRLIVSAAGAAQRGADWVLDVGSVPEEPLEPPRK